MEKRFLCGSELTMQVAVSGCVMSPATNKEETTIFIDVHIEGYELSASIPLSGLDIFDMPRGAMTPQQEFDALCRDLDKLKERARVAILG